jgi:hypothetical protein
MHYCDDASGAVLPSPDCSKLPCSAKGGNVLRIAAVKVMLQKKATVNRQLLYNLKII